MKNIYLALAALVAFTFSACSDDKDDAPNSGACYISGIQGQEDFAMCMEGKTKSITRAECEAGLEEADQGGTADIKDNCPTGYKLKCFGVEEGMELYVYVYGQRASLMTCAILGYEDAE